MRLMQAVRSSFKPSMSRCNQSMLCCLIDLTGMKRMRGRDAASQTAAASVVSFLPVTPSLRYGLTSCAERIRASRPSPMSLRAPVVHTRTGFHRNDAARRQPGTPLDEAVALQCSTGEDTTMRVYRMHLDHALGQIDPCADSMTSCNLLHGLPPSQASD